MLQYEKKIFKFSHKFFFMIFELHTFGSFMFWNKGVHKKGTRKYPPGQPTPRWIPPNLNLTQALTLTLVGIHWGRGGNWPGGNFPGTHKKYGCFVLYLFRDISSSNDTHMENLIQYKNSLKYKVGCFWSFSYICTIN